MQVKAKATKRLFKTLGLMDRLRTVLPGALMVLVAGSFAQTSAGGATSPVPATPTGKGSPDNVPTLLVFGDSLSAAYGIDPELGWVRLLGKQLAREGYRYKVVNASVSGETTGGGLSRLPRALELHKPRIVILELGANDGLRGLPVAQLQQHLDSMITLAKTSGARVLLLGMRVPPNYGVGYADKFNAVFGDVARRHKVAFMPFFLESVALDTTLVQEDNLHPTASAQPKLLAGVWPALKPLLEK